MVKQLFKTRKGWMIWRFVRLVVVLGVCVGPWPSPTTPYADTSEFRTSLERLDRSSAKIENSRIEVGVARSAIAPRNSVPLAGYIGQISQPNQGTSSPCFATALTIRGRTVGVTILAVDLLLIDERMARAVLTRTGLGRAEIYFTATHTHSGPGGWGLHPLERLVAGTYDPTVFEQLVASLSEVVLRSRSSLEPAEVAFVRVSCPGLQKNRIIPDQATNDELSAWIFRSIDDRRNRRTIATFAVFGAHATLGHPIPPRLDGDYPAAFARSLEQIADSGIVLFAAGTVGDAAPIRIPSANERKGIEAYGSALATRLANASKAARFTNQPDLANLVLAVDLPQVQVPFFTASLRFSPIASWWISPRSTYLHVLKVGPAFLVGFPGDYAGHLNSQLKGDRAIIATSFNGDYKGYLVSRTTFIDHPCYETRWMNFFGPDLGDFLTELAGRSVDHLLIRRP